jgi:hypothetical protein
MRMQPPRVGIIIIYDGLMGALKIDEIANVNMPASGSNRRYGA